MALPLSKIIPGVGRRFKVQSGEIDADAILKTALAGGFVKQVIVAGQDETMDTTITVTGIAVGDELVGVLVFDPGDGMGAGVDITARALTDFTISANTLTIGANSADNTGMKYVITYLDLT